MIVLVTTEADKTGRKKERGCFVCIDWGFFPVIFLHLWPIWIAERLADFCFLFPAGKIKSYKGRLIILFKLCRTVFITIWIIAFWEKPKSYLVSGRSLLKEKRKGSRFHILDTGILSTQGRGLR